MRPALREGFPPQATGEPGGLSGMRKAHAKGQLRGREKRRSRTGLTSHLGIAPLFTPNALPHPSTVLRNAAPFLLFVLFLFIIKK
ncbi:hypothetical protein DP116_23790 [Brasilonema bromeliae SPC951]|uniref:Uncharacterized protein n=1 Tax=Brasilonema bromeliae SPC951 TaxID=385972 RepID=A0ABX1PDC4_9CYAN|nr:hypothetical protein [Brasilonema bromeliae SPC951]